MPETARQEKPTKLLKLLAFQQYRSRRPRGTVIPLQRASSVSYAPIASTPAPPSSNKPSWVVDCSAWIFARSVAQENPLSSRQPMTITTASQVMGSNRRTTDCQRGVSTVPSRSAAGGGGTRDVEEEDGSERIMMLAVRAGQRRAGCTHAARTVRAALHAAGPLPDNGRIVYLKSGDLSLAGGATTRL